MKHENSLPDDIAPAPIDRGENLALGCGPGALVTAKLAART